MALPTHEQFVNTLQRSVRPVLLLPAHPSPDDFTAAFGCSSLLEKLNKPVEIVTLGGPTPKALSFLQHGIPVRGDISNLSKLTLHIDMKHAKIDELSYDVVDDELRIHLLPKTGTWRPDDVRISTESYRYDLIICIGGQDLESFGELHNKYADFFYQTPIVNIDHRTANEHFGQLNLVDVNAVSCSEVCHDLFAKIDPTLIDEQVATYFLTGMIHKTKSFRSQNVTPKTLMVASKLIAKGARRDEIVESLYKTRTVETLRLWGRALARLKSDKEHSVVWTMLTRHDFARAGASEADLESIIEELIMSAPEAKIAMILYETENGQISAILHATHPYDAVYLGAPFRALGTREEAKLHLKESDIVQAEKQIISHIKQHVANKRS